METLTWVPNPLEIEHKLSITELVYPGNVRTLNAGYSHMSVIPFMYEHVCTKGKVPGVDEVARYLWQYRQGSTEEVRQRTIKLTLDFFRELHTFGLLTKAAAFGLVKYSKAADVDLGIDYEVSISSYFLSFAATDSEIVGIQAAIGAKRSWDRNGHFQNLKARRKRRRGAATWDGPVYWLTNKNRKAAWVKESHVMIFTPGHIDDLVDEITGSADEDIGIQSQLEF